MKRTILIGSFLFWGLCIALTASAQDGGVGSVKLTPLPGPSIGIEGGLAQYIQNATIVCTCGTSFSGNKGNELSGSIFSDLPISQNFDIGIKVGLDHVNTALNANDASVKLTLLKFEPYIQYQILRSPFFVQSGLGISNVISNSITQTLLQGQSQSCSIVNIKYWLFSGLVSLGYNFDISSFTIAPIVTYDFPIIINQGNLYNWGFTSFKYALGVKYTL
jgi:hypothetical protein